MKLTVTGTLSDASALLPDVLAPEKPSVEAQQAEIIETLQLALTQVHGQRDAFANILDRALNRVSAGGTIAADDLRVWVQESGLQGT